MKLIGKKTLAWLLSILLIAGCCLTAGVPKDTVQAQIGENTGTYGDFIYYLDGTDPQYAVISGYTGPGGNLVLPETLDGYSVTGVGNEAFAENLDLTAVVIPAGITSVGYAAFRNCDNLVSVEFLGENVTMTSQCFVGCDSLREVTLPSKQEQIGWGLFMSCRSLEHITLPDTVTMIEDSAFYLSGLKELVVPASVESILYSALGGCTQLERVCFLGNTRVNDDLFASLSGSSDPIVYLQADSFTLSVAQQAGWNYQILPATGLPFMDVAPSGVYYTEAVQYVYGEGLMTGMNPTTFAPAENLSRAHFATILYRMAGSPSVAGMDNPFEDNYYMENFYYNAAIWCNNAGILTGYYNPDGSFTGRFGPSDNITREQLATMLYRYADYIGADTSARTSLDGFGDGAAVSSFAVEALEWAAAEGIVSGRATNPPTIAPQDNASRADTAVMIQRFLV